MRPCLRTAAICSASTCLVSHHLRALKAAGLARSRREGKIVFYSLTEEGDRLFRLLAGEPALAALPETRT